MDQKTINYYSENAQAVAARYESVVSSLSESFQDAFKARSKLLDIGCGSGRDLALLATMGHDCFGIDATPEFVELSQKLHPQLQGRIVPSGCGRMARPAPGVVFVGRCAGVNRLSAPLWGCPGGPCGRRSGFVRS